MEPFVRACVADISSNLAPVSNSAIKRWSSSGVQGFPALSWPVFALIFFNTAFDSFFGGEECSNGIRAVKAAFFG